MWLKSFLYLILSLLVLGLTFMMGDLAFQILFTDPDDSVVISRMAPWIKQGQETSLVTFGYKNENTYFRRYFMLEKVPEQTVIGVQAFRRFNFLVNGRDMGVKVRDEPSWLNQERFDITGLVKPGENLLSFVVSNHKGPRLLSVQLEGLGLVTDELWMVSSDGKNWEPAVDAGLVIDPPIRTKTPNSLASLLKTMPYLLFFFFGGFALSWVQGQKNRPRFQIKAEHLRLCFHFFWVALCINNLFHLPLWMGYDVSDHYMYIDLILSKGSIPLANDGNQAFQSPLTYLIAAIPTFVLRPFLSGEHMTNILRLLSMLCGMLQIEITWRFLRRLFPQPSQAALGALVVGFLPANIYISQAFGNEPLAGCLTALLVADMMILLKEGIPEKPMWVFVRLGLWFGLSLLAKVSVALLVPILTISLACLAYRHKPRFLPVFGNLICFGATSLLVAGWYYIRNWILLGQPFVGGWDPSRGIFWWQMPGVRLPADIFGFGDAILQPFYASIHGFWDGLYATLWSDGLMSGQGFADPSFVPWRLDFLVAQGLLSLPMTLILVLGLILILRDLRRRPSWPALFAVATLAMFTIGMLYVFLAVPVYGSTKATYALGALPCFALVLVTGMRPFLKKQLPRALLMGYLTCWSGFNFLGFLATHTNPPG